MSRVVSRLNATQSFSYVYYTSTDLQRTCRLLKANSSVHPSETILSCRIIAHIEVFVLLPICKITQITI